MGLGILPPPGIAPPKAPDVQDFVTSGTWTKPDGARLVLAELISGGGGGNSSGNRTGGGGGYARMLFEASSLGSTESVTVGAGGTLNAGSGGSSSFAGLSVTGGAYSSGSSYPRGGGSYSDGDAVLLSGATTGTPLYPGGGGASSGGGYSSQLGAGGGSANTVAPIGGILAASFGALQAGNGATSLLDAVAPGGGGSSNSAHGNGARGQVRITSYF